MPIKYLHTILLLCLVFPALLFVNSCAKDTAPVVAKAESPCPKSVPPAYTGALLIASKYDQEDESKSTLAKEPDKSSVAIKSQIDSFSKGIVFFSDYVISDISAAKKKTAASCLDLWLNTWAAAKALESREVTSNGKAVRKWALASIAMALFKTRQLEPDTWHLKSNQQKWLADLAKLVIEDYEPRLAPDFKYFNNHDHWAAWAVFATGMLLGDSTFTNWGNKVFERSLTRAVTDLKGEYAYFPVETARKQLGASYSHFSLAPLVLIAYYRPIFGYSNTDADNKSLEKLVQFACVVVLNPSAVAHIVKEKQSPVEQHRMAWLLPYGKQHPENTLVARLLDKYQGDVDGHSQMGGTIRPLFK